MLKLAAYGRIVRDPETRQTKTGKTMAYTTLAVDAAGFGAEKDADITLWLRVTAFGKLAEQLGRHAKGDLVSVSGSGSLNVWTDKNNVEHRDLQLVVDSLIGAKSTRPTRKSSETGQPRTPYATRNKAPSPEPEQYPFDDEIPF